MNESENRGTTTNVTISSLMSQAQDMSESMNDLRVALLIVGNNLDKMMSSTANCKSEVSPAQDSDDLIGSLYNRLNIGQKKIETLIMEKISNQASIATLTQGNISSRRSIETLNKENMSLSAQVRDLQNTQLLKDIEVEVLKAEIARLEQSTMDKLFEDIMEIEVPEESFEGRDFLADQ